MDYSKLSDAEIAQKVWFWWNNNIHHDNTICCISDGKMLYQKNRVWTAFDPCNNPADAWPIISANRISVEYDSEYQCDVPAEWVTAYGIDGLKVHVVAHQPCDKALRSAMIVFLMMQESANVQDNTA